MRKLIALSILLLVVYLIISLSRSIWDLWKKRDELTSAQMELEKLRAQNMKLKNQLEYVQTPAFVESEAREKLHFVKSDETVVFIPPDLLAAATVSATPTPPPPNWIQWMRLFISF